MKKLVAISLVLVLVLGLCATAFAAYPTATLKSYSKNQYVRRGKTVNFYFQLKSNSYYRIGSTYYAALQAEAHYKKTSGTTVFNKRWLFTGNKLNFKLGLKIPSNQKTGKYYLLYAALWRYSASGSWYYNKVKSTYFRVY